MILDKCKNCKHYKPHEIKVKSIFSKKAKTKYLRKGACTAYPSKETKNNRWCENYERKVK